MANVNPDDEAFIVHNNIRSEDGRSYQALSTGLTKREYFAGLAMQGLLADGACTRANAAGCAVRCADALLAALATPAITPEAFAHPEHVEGRV